MQQLELTETYRGAKEMLSALPERREVPRPSGSRLPAHVQILRGDCRELLQTLEDNSIDACVCDPPYGLSKEPDPAEVLTHWLAGDDYQHSGSGFMGKSWDSFVPGPAVWREVLRVLKPGGHLLAFSSTRTATCSRSRCGSQGSRSATRWPGCTAPASQSRGTSVRSSRTGRAGALR